MNKTISQISLIILIMMIGIIFVGIEQAYAATIPQVSSHTAKVGETVTVTVSMPDGTTGYDGSITFDTSKLKYISNSNNGAVSGNKIAVSDVNTSLAQVGNLTITFQVIAEGEAIVASNLRCVDKDNNVIHSGANAGTIKTPTQSAPNTTTNTDNSSSGSTTSDKDNTATSTEPKFTDVNETVYTKESCNVRESYSTSSKKITKLEKGVELKRTGVGDNGWSKVDYNGKTVYISSQFLTTEKPADPTFKDVDETMYAIQDCNIRKSWSTSSEKAGYLKKADEVKRTGIGDNGWSRIEYNGQVAYVATRLISSEEPDEEENNIIENNTVDNNVVDENVVVNPELGKLQNEIGVIPEVGNNFSEYAYIIITLTALAFVLYINYKSRNIEND